MPTAAGSSPFVEIQQRAQRGTSAFVACGQQRRVSSARAGSKQPLFSAQHLSRHAAQANFAKLRGSCMLGAFLSQPGLRLSASSYVGTRCAAASHLRTVQGLTPRSSGAPTAAHQARSVVRSILHSPGLACYRSRPLSSHVRRQPYPIWSALVNLYLTELRGTSEEPAHDYHGARQR